jgi:proteasome activator subunit 4
MFQYLFYRKDPRRVQPLVDYLLDEFNSLDFNGESSFDAVKILSFFRSFYDEMDWKFSAWTDDVVKRCWPEICGEHDDVSDFFLATLIVTVNNWT